MVPPRTRRSRAVLVGGSLCFAAVLAILVGGTARADTAVHHRTPAATTAWIATDNSGAALRVDQPVAVAAGALALLGAAVVLRRRTATPAPIRFTAHSAAPRGPPGQAR